MQHWAEGGEDREEGEAAGVMPRLCIVCTPQPHTASSYPFLQHSSTHLCRGMQQTALLHDQQVDHRRSQQDPRKTVEGARVTFMSAMSDAGLKPTVVYHNLTPAELYEKVLKHSC